jgi:dihydroorotate dehydrogenase (fumarate)
MTITTDLTTTWLGLRLANPLVAAASPLTKHTASTVALAKSGVGAIVLHSLFEEAYAHAADEHERTLTRGTASYGEALDFFPDLDLPVPSPDDHLDLVRRTRSMVELPLVGSLNARADGAWVEQAKALAGCGVDALELNVYDLATDPDRSSAAIEDGYLRLVRHLRAHVSVPLTVKLASAFTGLPHFCRRLCDAGANGVTLFNRFYQPDLDLETLEVVPGIRLSTSDDLLLPLRWTAILHGRIDADLALTGGVHTASDALKAVAAGADVVQIAAAFLRHGPHHAGVLLDGMRHWMIEHGYESVRQLRGCLSQRAVGDASLFERANYLKALRSYDDRLP